MKNQKIVFSVSTAARIWEKGDTRQKRTISGSRNIFLYISPNSFADQPLNYTYAEKTPSNPAKGTITKSRFQMLATTGQAKFAV